MPTLFDQFAVLKPDMLVDQRPVTADFYEQLDVSYESFANHVLISAHHFTEDWPTWEIHPKGDEVVVLTSGKATFLLKQDNGETAVTLDKPGSYVVVPKNTWHTARISENASMMFITPGEGTLNEETPQR